jgi:hypothetical protein
MWINTIDASAQFSGINFAPALAPWTYSVANEFASNAGEARFRFDEAGISSDQAITFRLEVRTHVVRH